MQPQGSTPPVPQPNPTPPIQPTTQAGIENPGKTLGIVGLVLTIVGIGLVGLILAIIGLIKSKKAGFKNTPALVAIILNVVAVVIVIPLLVLLMLFTFNNIQDRAQPKEPKDSTTAAIYSAEGESSAVSMVSSATAYAVIHGEYPKTIADLQSSEESKPRGDIVFAKQPLKKAPSDPKTVAFYTCGADQGVMVEYWDYKKKKAQSKKSGGVTEPTLCSFVAQ
jgi:hypothetical protein